MMARVFGRLRPWWILAAALLAGSVTTAPAAPVPVGAENRALGLDPLLRGGPVLAFQHPQQAALQQRQLLVLDTGASVNAPGGMGGIGALGRHRLFLLSSREAVTTGTMSGLRAGWGGPAGRLRWGLSVGGYMYKESSTGERLSWSGAGTNYSYSFNALDTNAWSVESQAGVGLGGGRSHLDMTWETRWEPVDRATAAVYESRTDADTTLISFEGDRRPFHRYHLRCGVPLGSKADLVVVGQWGGRHERWHGMFRGFVFDEDLFRQEALRGWRDAWTAAAAVSFPAWDLDRVTASAAWTSSRLPEYLASGDNIVHREDSRRAGGLALSVEERVWREIGLLAGMRRSYSRIKRDAQTLDGPSAVSATTELHETMGFDFAWGAAWFHGPYRVGALLSSTLSVDAPFVSLDLGYRF